MNFNHILKYALTESEQDLIEGLASIRDPLKMEEDFEYVCHTSTIPLATVMDHWKSNGDDIVVRHHQKMPGYNCHCIHSSKKEGFSSMEEISADCSCRKIIKNAGKEKVPYICFNRLLPSLFPEFYIEENVDPIDVTKVMFCFNGTGVLEDNYPYRIQVDSGMKGWSGIRTPTQIYKALKNLYWFRFAMKSKKKKKRIKRIFSEIFKNRGSNNMKKGVEQSLHTLNGMIIKMFIVSSREVANYRWLRKRLYGVFLELLREYYADPQTEEEAKELEEKSIFKEIKDFSKTWKKWFHSSNYEYRESVTRYRFKSKALSGFLEPITAGVMRRITSCWTAFNVDYTQSISWILTGAVVSVTRVLGLLPPYLCKLNTKRYKEKMEQEIKLQDEQLHQIYVLLNTYMRGVPEIKEDFLLRFSDKEIISDLTEDEKYVFSHVSFEKKRTASVTSKVAEGGKLEDARLLLNRFSRNRWEIPKYNLRTGEVTEVFVLPKDLLELEELSTPLFWISYQITLNSLIKHHGLKRYGDIYKEYRFLTTGNLYLPNICDVEIITIAEPGKQRILIKSQSPAVWVLNPASKVLQYTLSLDPEHKEGLTSSSQGWKHSMKFGSHEHELFDSAGRLYPDIEQCFQDWTEATDNMAKGMGLALLQSFMLYLSFPEFYRDICILLMVLPSSYIHHHEDYGGTKKVSRGFLRRGFMMGNPLTKTILHLSHILGIEFSNQVTGKQFQDSRVSLL